MKIRIRYNMDRAQFSVRDCLKAGFGERNQGLVIESPGATVREAFDNYMETLKPGDRLNPFYLSISEA